MSTTAPSEFIIGHSADDAADRRSELRKIAWALVAALMIHLLVGSFIAVFHDSLFRRVEPLQDETPMEMTMVDLPATQPAETQKNSMFMETDESKASKEEPKEKTFESNANSLAASQSAATGELPLPSQEGRDRPNVDLNSQAYSLPIEGAQPQPSVAPQSTPQESAAPQETPREDQLAMLTKPQPTPQPSAAQTPAPVRSTYRPMKQQTKISGAISNRGPASINAMGTPLGRYQKILNDAIGSRWYADIERRGESANVGDVVVHFFVDRSGEVKNLRVLQNTSNETFANICLQAILEANLPPIPDEVAAALPSEGLEVEALRFSIIPR